mgnify:CR=1 FL=1
MEYGFAPHSNSERNGDDIEFVTDFYPPLNVAEFASLYNIAADLPDDTVRHFIRLAMTRTAIALEAWKEDQRAAGVSEAPAEEFKAAVYTAAKADLLREHIAMDRKADAENAATQAEELVAHYEALHTRALANIMGEQSIGVHLI